MSNSELAPTEQVLRGEVLKTDEEYLQAVYTDSGIEGDLARYLDTGSSYDSDTIELGLSRFCDTITGAAWKDGTVDVAVVRSGFDIVTASMNEVASRKYGYVRQGVVRSLLSRAGITGVKSLQADQYVRGLDDRYWSTQFMHDLKSGGSTLSPRQPGEAESAYFTRYTYECMRGFIFAPFTYLASPGKSTKM